MKKSKRAAGGLNDFARWFILVGLCLGLGNGGGLQAIISTDNLRNYERNLDILGDKTGSLHQLIEELQRFRVTTTSGPAVQGGSVAVSGMATEDTIVAVVRFSSANVVTASSVTVVQVSTDSSAGPTLTLRSKVWGTMGNNIKVRFTQISSQAAAQEGVLTVNTTGYLIEVKLSTGDFPATEYSSATRVCNAINNHPEASQLISCTPATFSSGTVLPLTYDVALVGGLGTVISANSVDPSYFTHTASATVRVSTNAPVDSNDVLQFKWYDAPDTK